MVMVMKAEEPWDLASCNWVMSVSLWHTHTADNATYKLQYDHICIQYICMFWSHSQWGGGDLGPETNWVRLNRTSHLLQIDWKATDCVFCGAKTIWTPLCRAYGGPRSAPPSIAPCSWTSFSGIARHSYRVSIVTFFSGLSCVNRINTLTMGDFRVSLVGAMDWTRAFVGWFQSHVHA